MKLRYKLALCGFVGLLLFLGAVAWLIQWSGQRALEREIELVIAAGGARDFSAFAELSIPDDENAAVAWLGVFRELDKFDAPASGMTNDQVHDAWSEETLDGLGPAMKARQQVFELADAAARLERVRWPLDYADPVNFFESDCLGQSRKLSRFLVIDAAVAISEDDWERADQSFASALALSEDTAEVTLLINALVGFSIDTYVIEQLEDVQPMAWDRLPTTAAALAARDYRGWLSRALLGEVVYGLGYESSEDDPFPAEGLRRVGARLWGNHDLAFYIMRLRELSALASLPYHELQPQLRIIEDYEYPWVYPLSESFLESIFACLRVAARMELRGELVVWAIALAGTEPVADPPLDPLTGQSLKSWRTPEGGWVLWSVEAEKRDSGIAVREQAVWRTARGALPPELQPFAYDLNDEEE